jgi:hypothetical protein
MPGDLRIGVLCPDLVAEEPRRLAGGVGDQRLGFGQLQLEFLTQESPDLRLDLLSFAPGTGEPEQEVVAVPHIPKPPIARIVRILARQGAAVTPKLAHRLPVAVPFRLRDLALDTLVGGVDTATPAPVVLRYQPLFNEPVEPVQVNIG